MTPADLHAEVDTILNAEPSGPPPESWSQRSWRPWNGFWFAPTVGAIYVLLPMLGKPVPAVPEVIWIGWLALLGISASGRNRLKALRAGASADGMVASAIKAIKG